MPEKAQPKIDPVPATEAPASPALAAGPGLICGPADGEPVDVRAAWEEHAKRMNEITRSGDFPARGPLSNWTYMGS